jgi:hypothetical protein
VTAGSEHTIWSARMRGSESGYQVATQSCGIQIKYQVLDCFDRGHHLSTAAANIRTWLPAAAAFSPIILRYVLRAHTWNESSQTIDNSSSLCDSLTPPAPLICWVIRTKNSLVFKTFLLFWRWLPPRSQLPFPPIPRQIQAKLSPAPTHLFARDCED